MKVKKAFNLSVKLTIDLISLKFFRSILRSASPVSIRVYLSHKLIGINRTAYWPTHSTSVVIAPQNIEIGIQTAPGLSPNCYIQGMAGIKVGDYSLIGPGVGIISANHDIYDISAHRPSNGVVVGSYCWIGANAVLLPGVRLGDHTVVAAGSIVTKPFTSGYCILAGNPAKIIKTLNPDRVIRKRVDYEYIGYYKPAFFLRNIKSWIRLRYDAEVDSFVSLA